MLGACMDTGSSSSTPPETVPGIPLACQQPWPGCVAAAPGLVGPADPPWQKDLGPQASCLAVQARYCSQATPTRVRVDRTGEKTLGKHVKVQTQWKRCGAQLQLTYTSQRASLLTGHSDIILRTSCFKYLDSFLKPSEPSLTPTNSLRFHQQHR
jgi:hypothetical protein